MASETERINKQLISGKGTKICPFVELFFSFGLKCPSPLYPRTEEGFFDKLA